jgi:hypothetical protein
MKDFMMCAYGLVAQFGWSVRLITERSRVQISPGPPFYFEFEFFNVSADKTS